MEYEGEEWCEGVGEYYKIIGLRHGFPTSMSIFKLRSHCTIFFMAGRIFKSTKYSNIQPKEV